MNTTAFKTASEHAGPIILGAGIAMMTVGVLTTGHNGHAQAAPAPTVTVTPPPRPVTAAPSPPRASATLVLEHTDVTRPPLPRPPSTSGDAPSDRMATDQTPNPARTGPAPSCGRRVLAVRLPLGVLPDCLITVEGGNR